MAMALHILTGPRRGQEVILPAEGDMLLFAKPDGDVTIAESGLPAPHAAVIVKGGNIILKALSLDANLLVNRKKVIEVPLAEGDRIRLEKVNLMLVSVSRFSQYARDIRQATAPSPAQAAPANSPGEASPAPNPATEGALRGSLQLMRPADVVQLLCQTGKNGMLYLSSRGRKGTIRIHDGRIYKVTLTPHSHPDPTRMLFRLFRWTDGQFEFQPMTDDPGNPEITEPTEVLIIRALHEQPYWDAILKDLPPADAALSVRKLSAADRAKLSATEMFILGLILMHGKVQAVIDNHPEGDLKACTLLVDLLNRHIITVDWRQ